MYVAVLCAKKEFPPMRGSPLLLSERAVIRVESLRASKLLAACLMRVLLTRVRVCVFADLYRSLSSSLRMSSFEGHPSPSPQQQHLQQLTQMQQQQQSAASGFPPPGAAAQLPPPPPPLPLLQQSSTLSLPPGTAATSTARSGSEHKASVRPPVESVAEALEAVGEEVAGLDLVAVAARSAPPLLSDTLSHAPAMQALLSAQAVASSASTSAANARVRKHIAESSSEEGSVGQAAAAASPGHQLAAAASGASGVSKRSSYGRALKPVQRLSTMSAQEQTTACAVEAGLLTASGAAAAAAAASAAGAARKHKVQSKTGLLHQASASPALVCGGHGKLVGGSSSETLAGPRGAGASASARNAAALDTYMQDQREQHPAAFHSKKPAKSRRQAAKKQSVTHAHMLLRIPFALFPLPFSTPTLPFSTLHLPFSTLHDLLTDYYVSVAFVRVSDHSVRAGGLLCGWLCHFCLHAACGRRRRGDRRLGVRRGRAVIRGE